MCTNRTSIWNFRSRQNGLAERKIGDVVDKARTLLIQAHAPKNLWGFAVLTATHLINRLASRILNYQSPVDILETQFPNVRLKTGLPVKIFGCTAYVQNPVHKHDKWTPKGLKCVLLGYSTTHKGYKVEESLPSASDSADIPHSDLPQHSSPVPLLEPAEISAPLPVTEVSASSDSTMESEPSETVLISAPEGTVIPVPSSSQRRYLSEPVINPTHTEPQGEWSIALRKGKRSCVKARPYDTAHLSLQHQTFLTNLTEQYVPKTAHEAMRIPKWKAAMG
ncbi:uncharacterized protein LOC144714200 [Wolffia australiana]